MRKERSDGIVNVMSVRNSEPASVRLGVRRYSILGFFLLYVKVSFLYTEYIKIY